MSREVFEPHSEKQDRALFSEKRGLLIGSGTQWGKTKTGAIRMKMKLHTYTDPEDNFIITAPSYPIMVQSTLPPFLEIMRGLGTLNKKDNCFKMHRGGTVWLRTETDPDSIVGITKVRHIWGDEAGKYRRYFWENIQARADFYGATIDFTTSPYALNWIYTDLIKPFKEGKLKDWEVIQAASWENPFHSLYDPARLAEKRAMMDERRFKMIYGGEWGKMDGLVYDCWDDDANLVPAFDLPTGTLFYGGVDWGYDPDPFVLKVRAITPDGRHYGVSEFVKTRMTITDIKELCKQKREVWKIQTFFCDPSQPGYIEELNRAGCTAVGATNDIRPGIDAHYELIKTRRYKEFIGACPNSADERETYHYPEPKDLKPDENAKKDGLPVDQSNHCMDADRYLSIMTHRRGSQKLTPKVPGEEKPRRLETVDEKLARLRRKRSDRHTERWS